MTKTLRAALLLAALSLGLITLVPATPVEAAAPCCGVVAIDQAKGLVTIRDKATGQTHQVTVKDVARLKTLKVGQAVHADLKAKQLR